MANLHSRTTLLLNWRATAYHTPIFVAQAKGYYRQEGIHLAIMEPNDPSDVTEIVGLGKVDFGLKAMIHTVAARAKGYDLTSIGTLLDEPPTGLIALKSSGIKTFHDIVGKRVGYIGEFGKKIIDDLAILAGITPSSYETVRIGMNLTDAICRDKIDVGIGFINFQRVELEHLRGETIFLPLDQLAGLGCCCFCSIQFIVSEATLKQPELIKGFLRATQRGAAFTTSYPYQAFELLCEQQPQLRQELYKQVFIHTLPFFSQDLFNVPRDWRKVGLYSQHLQIIDKEFDVNSCYSNEFLPASPYSELDAIACCLESPETTEAS